MISKLQPVLLLVCTIAVACATVQAQTQPASGGGSGAIESTSDSYGLHKGTNEFGVWGTVSFHSPTFIGTTRDVRFGSIAFRYGRTLAANKTVAFQWTIDASPVAILSVKQQTFTETAPGTFVVSSRRENTYGAGASPIGFKFNFRPQRRVQPYGSTSGGFLIFREPVPVPQATRFNFTFDFSGGVQIVNRSRRTFSVGYRFQHISNGGQSRVNPGVDMHLIQVGFSILR